MITYPIRLLTKEQFHRIKKTLINGKAFWKRTSKGYQVRAIYEDTDEKLKTLEIKL